MCLFLCCAIAVVNAQDKNRPNIVFIFSDDLSFRDLSCYGQTRYKTPNLDRLSKVSTRFTQAYAAAPECAPSRASLMTGIHTGKGSIRVNSSARGFENLPDSDYTFAEMLKKAGYTNGVIGKWGIGGFNTSGNPLKQGFDYQYGYQSHFEAHSYFPWSLYENGQEIQLKGNRQFKMDFLYAKETNLKAYDYDGMYNSQGKLINPDPAQRVYASDLFDEKSAEFISKNKAKPFFLYFTTNLPHGPAIVDDLRQLKNEQGLNILSKEWGAMVERLDISVGKLIDKLKEEGVYENTMIIFASDNGYAMHNLKRDKQGNLQWPDDEGLNNKGPFDGGKFSTREGGMRIPFFIHYPGQKDMKISPQPVWLVDVFPTLSELVNQTLPTKLDGQSLLPILQGKPSEISYERYMYFSRNTEQAVRKGSWYGIRENKNTPLKLFLLDEDQKCERNIAEHYPQVAMDLTRYLDTAYTIHPWYWNPGETLEQYQAKQKMARETGQVLQEQRPNGMDLMPWERKAALKQ